LSDLLNLDRSLRPRRLGAGWPVDPSLIALQGRTATIGGIMNFMKNMIGVAAPIITGIIVAATKSFMNTFLVAGVVLLVGIFSYIVILGKIVPIPAPPLQT
jgi:ACS family D-galactonate transporter-like MFS transporter